MRTAGLRLALDVGSVRAEPAGIGTYAASLAGALAKRMPGALALIGVRPEARIGAPPAVPRLQFRSRTYHAWLQLHAERDARRAGASLVHYTNAAAPLIARLPFVVTVHDLSLLRMPRAHPPARLASVPVMLAALPRARAIIVPSSWTRRELGRALFISPRRIVVVEHAPYEHTATPTSAETEGVLRTYGVADGGYLLAVGTLEPRKNLVRLVEAFERLAANRPDLRLVLAGAPGWGIGPILRRIEASPERTRIVLAGYVDPHRLGALIAASAAVCYVSTYEGYGMPILEAMALGAAVVASDRTATPEAAGGAAVLVDPYDAADMERGMREAMARRTELGAAGRVRASRRAWGDVAAEHIDVYRWALGR